MNCPKKFLPFSATCGFSPRSSAGQSRSPFLRVGRLVFFLLFGLVVLGGLTPAAKSAERTLGDINNDGVVDVLDIVQMNGHAEKKHPKELDFLKYHLFQQV